MATKLLLKDILFNQTKVEQLAKELQHAYPKFKKNAFVADVLAKFPDLELKARITWIAQCLQKYLPSDYNVALDIVVQALPIPNNPELSDNDFGDFIYAPYAEYVAKYGCTKPHLKQSLAALYEITQRFSAEDAIRYFINAFPEETLQKLQTWAADSHYHVRRLASEGTRPKLPWAQKIKIPIRSALPILDRLFSDPTRYVTRSVANHINDVSKLDPDLAIETLIRWQKSGQQQPQEMAYITNHALRTLTKQGNPKALAILGFDPAAKIDVSKFVVPKEIKMDSTLEFSLAIKSDTDAKALIDYVIYFQNKVGKQTRKKIFKLTKLTLKKNKPVVVTKRHTLRQQMTTRTLYPGIHEIEIQINGRKCAKTAFLLK